MSRGSRDTPSRILWSPFEMLDYWGRLAEVVRYPELVDFCGEVSEVVRQIEAEHLWGCLLLVASRDVTRASMPDRYRNLLAAIVNWAEASAAIRQAAESLFEALHVDPGQFDDGQPEFLVAMLEMGAFSKRERKTTPVIVKKALNSDKGDKYKGRMADLCFRRLARSSEGAGGGYWLTAVGRSIAGKLRDAGVRLPDQATADDAPVSGDRPRRKTRPRSSPQSRAASRRCRRRVSGGLHRKFRRPRCCWGKVLNTLTGLPGSGCGNSCAAKSSPSRHLRRRSWNSCVRRLPI